MIKLSFKMSDNTKEFTKNIYPERSDADNEIKTTNVNILLNRVRENKKKTFKKRIFFSLLLAALISSFAVFLIV